MISSSVSHKNIARSRSFAKNSTRETDVLILGAGLAGTSLAHHLERLGFEGTIALLDARTDFRADTRWCTWSEIPLAMKSAVTHEWHAWEVRDQSRVARSFGTPLPYRHLSAPLFFAQMHARWHDENSQTRLFLGQRATNIASQNDAVLVRSEIVQGESSNGETTPIAWRARWVFDARGGSVLSPQMLNSARAIHWRQKFVGWTVRFETDVFSPDTMTLMDFRTSSPVSASGMRHDAHEGVRQGVNFVYLLPFSARHALVEATSFGPHDDARSLQALEDALGHYLAKHTSGGFVVEAREAGDLPMATAKIPEQIAPRIGAIGLAGGAGRAATGYAFARIQEQTQRIAGALCAQKSPFSDAASLRETARQAKFHALDAIFLEALGRGPDFARDCFFRMVERVPADAFARFLSETSTLADETALIAALPKIAFLDATQKRVRAQLFSRQMKRDRKFLALKTAALHSPELPGGIA